MGTKRRCRRVGAADAEPEEVKRLNLAWREDRKAHNYRTVARIATMDEEVMVVPIKVMAEIVAEDGDEGEPNRDEHNHAMLSGFVSLALEAIHSHGLPEELPAGPWSGSA